MKGPDRSDAGGDRVCDSPAPGGGGGGADGPPPPPPVPRGANRSAPSPPDLPEDGRRERRRPRDRKDRSTPRDLEGSRRRSAANGTAALAPGPPGGDARFDRRQ